MLIPLLLPAQIHTLDWEFVLTQSSAAESSIPRETRGAFLHLEDFLASFADPAMPNAFFLRAPGDEAEVFFPGDGNQAWPRTGTLLSIRLGFLNSKFSLDHFKHTTAHLLIIFIFLLSLALLYGTSLLWHRFASPAKPQTHLIFQTHFLTKIK